MKVADDGSGSQNVFYLLAGSDTGAGTMAPSLDLSFGFKYKFDISDSSNTGHPLKFSIVQDGSHNGGSEFTTNVTNLAQLDHLELYVQLERSLEKQWELQQLQMLEFQLYIPIVQTIVVWVGMLYIHYSHLDLGVEHNSINFY